MAPLSWLSRGCLAVALLCASGCDAVVRGNELPDAQAVDAPARDLGLSTGIDAAVADGGVSVAQDAGEDLGVRADAGALADLGMEPGDAGSPPPAPIACSFRAADFGSARQSLDVPAGSSTRLRFEVLGLPEPGLVTRATLSFVGHDLDHPGREGSVRVNGGAPLSLPAMAGWDNVSQDLSLDITGRTVVGRNEVVFAPGELSRNYFEIGRVELDLEVRLETCPGSVAPPGPRPIRRLRYDAAEYVTRRNWVLRCDFLGGYAFTARGADQVPLDCGGLYDPDGARTGRAIFRFPAVLVGPYDVELDGRHSANRDPRGTEVRVGGVARRLDQTDGDTIATDVWGRATLSGEVVVEVVSTGESVSVSEVRLVPR